MKNYIFTNNMIVEFGDNVRFVDNETTRTAGVDLKEGVCRGFSTPSITNIEFIGKTEIGNKRATRRADGSWKEEIN